MADVAQLLQSLRPMREPPAPSTILPFFVMLAIGVLAAAIGFIVFRQLQGMRAGVRRSATAALIASRRLVPSERLAAQAQVLRRIVRTVFGDDAARAEGEAWLTTLDRAFATSFFTAGEGRVFGSALYERGSDGKVEAIDHAVLALMRNARI